MAKTQVTLTGTTDNELLAIVHTPRHNDGYGGSVFVKINSGTGTVTLQVSPDGGTTKYTLKDLGQTNLTGTANFYGNFVLGIPNNNDGELRIYADLSGGSNADVTVTLFDVR